MKRIILFLVLIVLGLSGKGTTAYCAQLDDLPQPASPEASSDAGIHSADLGEELPPPREGHDTGSLGSVAAPHLSDQLPEEIIEPFSQGEDFRIFAREPALLESTGTWLRRGFWYTEVEVVISDRIWRRDDFSLMSQEQGTVTDSNGRGIGIGSNYLLIEGGRFGAEAIPRLKLGRFLFRDDKNRDHTAEFIIYGGGQWSQDGRLDANPSNESDTTTLRVISGVDRGNRSFDGATSSDFVYNSRLNSFELNYQVKSRMKRDRMELEPSGRWVRRAQPSRSYSMLAGIRYIDLDEDIAWRAFGIPDADNDNKTEIGNYNVDANNQIFGPQLGFSWTYERARWSLGTRVKGGILINRSVVRSNFLVTGNVTSGDNNIEDDNLTFLTEAALIGKWHLRPNVSLRAGIEGMFLSSLALAPNQLNFIPVSTSEIIADGQATFLGALIGIETYW